MLAGFRLERVIGRGRASVVFEATQVSLQRVVAFKLFAADPTSGGLRWPEHPNAVSLYAAGPCERGYFIAMQLVRGASLSERLSGRRPGRAALLGMLDDVAAALDAAHRAGITHGAVAAHNVLVDESGRAFLSDFGLGSGARGATPEADRREFAALVSECLGDAGLDQPAASAGAIVAAARARSTPKRRERWPLVVAAALAAGAVGAWLLASGGEPEQAPAQLPGTVTLGSALPADGIRWAVDCKGRPPSGGSEPCVLVQTRLAGRPLAVGAEGVIRRWTVRGARGELALAVLRRHGASTYLVARTQYTLIPDEGVHALRANLPVLQGDLVGLAVGPGTGVGLRTAAGATTRRRFGVADLTPAPFDPAIGADEELLLRVEYVRAAHWLPPGVLTGRAAAQAPDGRELDTLPAQGDLTVAAVSVRGRIAVDLFAGRRRLTRVAFPGDPAGRLESLYTLRVRFGQPIVRLRWRNPRGSVSRDYVVTARSLVPID